MSIEVNCMNADPHSPHYWQPDPILRASKWCSGRKPTATCGACGWTGHLDYGTHACEPGRQATVEEVESALPRLIEIGRSAEWPSPGRQTTPEDADMDVERMIREAYQAGFYAAQIDEGHYLVDGQAPEPEDAVVARLTAPDPIWLFDA